MFHAVICGTLNSCLKKQVNIVLVDLRIITNAKRSTHLRGQLRSGSVVEVS